MNIPVLTVRLNQKVVRKKLVLSALHLVLGSKGKEGTKEKENVKV